MTHLTIKEAIKIIERKTDQTLTYPEIAQLYVARELQVCFRWQADKCRLGAISNGEGFALISEVKLIAVRGTTGFNRKMHLTPSHHHEIPLFHAIEENSKEPIEMQVVRPLGSTWQLLLMRDVSDQYLYSIDSKYEKDWQIFDSPEYFLDFERYGGASASYTITIDDLLITRESLNAYIAKAKAQKGIYKYSPDETKKLAIRLARHIIAKDPDGIVSKAQLAKSIIKALKGTEHDKNIKGSDEKGREDNVENWIKELKKGKVGRKSNNQNEEMQALISEAIADFPEEINRQK